MMGSKGGEPACIRVQDVICTELFADDDDDFEIRPIN